MGKAREAREREVIELTTTTTSKKKKNHGMADPYWSRYTADAAAATAATATGADNCVPRSAYSAHLPSESSTLASQHLMQTNNVHGLAAGRVERDVLTESTQRYGYSSYMLPESSSVAPKRPSRFDVRDTPIDHAEREVMTSSVSRSGYQSHLLPEFPSLAPQHLLRANDVHGLSSNHIERDVLTSSAFRPGYPAHLQSESFSAVLHYLSRSSDGRAPSTDRVERTVLMARPGVYGLDDNLGIGVRPETVPGALATGLGTRSYPSLGEDPTLLSQRQDVAVGISPRFPDEIHERPDSLRRVDALPPPTGKSNILFIDGLPKDCTRRELGHLFRPFIGFKDIKLVHKELRRSGDKAMVLCFVVFDDANCALTALEALQGYKFDDRKLDSPVLRIHFAEFPFRLPSASEDEKMGIQSQTQAHGEK